MAILNIVQYPDLRLRRQGQRVIDPQAKKIQKIIQDITKTLLQLRNCAGLAATQLELDEPPAITIIKLADSTHPQDLLCLINPEITHREGTTCEPEGCMSIYPDQIQSKVKRAAKIQVQALNPQGKRLNFEAEGFLAKCIQHECDHLQGILYLDHLNVIDKLTVDQEIAQLQARPHR